MAEFSNQFSLLEEQEDGETEFITQGEGTPADSWKEYFFAF